MTIASRPVPKANVYTFTEPFWTAVRDRRLFLQYCPVTERFQHVPRPVSVHTGKRKLVWREVSGKGVIYAVTILRVGRPDVASRLPLCAATIELDEHVRIIGNLIETAPEDCKIGRRVELAWDMLDDGVPYPAFRVTLEGH
jgi:uncharacterized OB-fold protein